jgi:hypothetical protein
LIAQYTANRNTFEWAVLDFTDVFERAYNLREQFLFELEEFKQRFIPSSIQVTKVSSTGI